jgi:deoxyribodipyrimidine photolyase-related protein
MSDYKDNKDNKIMDKYTWCEVWDALYYRFISKNYNMLKKIYATARNVSHWDKKTKEQQEELLKTAEKYLKFIS